MDVSLAIVSSVQFDLDTTVCAEQEVVVEGETFTAARPTGSITLPNGSAAGCDSVINVSLSFFPAATGAFDTTVCGLDPVLINGVSLTPEDPSRTVVLPAAAASGCDSTLLITVTYLAPARRALDTVRCAGAVFELAGRAFPPENPSGLIILEGAAANGCDSLIDVSVTYLTEPDVVIDTVICPGAELVVGEQTFTTPQAGTRVLLPEPSAAGCERYAVVSLAVIGPGELTLSGDPLVCADNLLSFTVTNSGGGTVTFALSTDPGERLTIGPDATLNLERNLTPGTELRLVDVSSAGGCTPTVSGALVATASDLTLAVEVNSGDGVFAVSCDGANDGFITALASGGREPYAYRWETGEDGASLRNLPAGTYRVTVTGAGGCRAEASTELTAPAAIVATVAELPANCLTAAPSLIVRDIQGGSEPYVGGTDPAQPLSVLSGLPDTLTGSVGTVNLVIEDANGCQLRQTFDLPPAAAVEATVSPEFAVVPVGDSAVLRLTTTMTDYTFTMTPGPDTVYQGSEIMVWPRDPITDYEIVITDAFGCSATVISRIVVDDLTPVYAPTAFSPNGDGNNDVYRLFASERVRSLSNFSIFDRWGNVVFEQREAYDPLDPVNEAIGWNGEGIAGSPNTSGVYYYTVDVETDDDRRITLRGDLLLFR